MILSGEAIKERLEKGEIFRAGTWHPDCVKEASYTLRIAPDGMLIDGKQYPPGRDYPEPSVKIGPGQIAILSTIERFNMPKDLVGHQGIRLNWAVRGLTGLMGIQVDPLYGSAVKNERLYLRFANLGNQTVYIQPGEAVFNIEFQAVDGAVNREAIDHREGARRPMWDRLSQLVLNQSEPSWSYATRVEADVRREVESVRRGLEPVVMFGVFLVSTTLLGVILVLLLTFEDTPAASVPTWVTSWGWVILMIVLGVGGIATAFVGIATGVRFIRGR